ncbi:MAG: hybrid sensor histidine kinase/response regulator [Anaerolineae bacterium]|nr:hybrid sensor histidine kinase/response regulator [Anaerolineae bacterium]
MTEPQQEDILEQELRHALQYLYDPTELRKNQLLALLGIEAGPSPLTQLRRTLSGSIEALKPGSHVPADAPAWRVYNILTYRFVEQLSQRETAADMNLSVRQLRRNEHEAIQVLTHALSHRYELPAPSIQPDRDGDGKAAAVERDRVQELAWLQQTVPSEVIDVRALLESVISTATPLLRESYVEVVFDVQAGVPLIMGQLATVRQALLNLLSAAVPAATGGHGHIQVSSSDQEVRLTLCMWRGDESLVPMDEQLVGSLDISRELVELGGGTLNAASATDGCSIIMTLPGALPLRIRVHVIDDNADTLQLFQRYLTGTQFDLTSSRDPEEALAAVVEAAPQAIVLDVMLPGVDGWELLGRLREHPQTRGIPVVICTILPQEKLALALGAAAFLQKPFTRDALLSMLASLTRSQG